MCQSNRREDLGLDAGRPTSRPEEQPDKLMPGPQLRGGTTCAQLS